MAGQVPGVQLEEHLRHPRTHPGAQAGLVVLQHNLRHICISYDGLLSLAKRRVLFQVNKEIGDVFLDTSIANLL